MRGREMIGVLSIGLCVATGVQAQTNEQAVPKIADQDPPSHSNRVTQLGEFLVEAPRVNRDLIQTPMVESASLDIATSVVEEETIRLQNAATLVEAMDYSTGIFTEQRGRKEKTLTSFRGQIYPYPDFALNGVWQRSFWEVPSFLPAAAIGRIEVLRSGGAILVGPNSGLVGAINIVPRRFQEDTTLFNVEGGSYGTLNSSVIHGDRFEHGDYTVGVSHQSTGGPKGENAAQQFDSVFGTTGWDLSDNVHLEFMGYYMTGYRELRRVNALGTLKSQKTTESFDPCTAYGGILRTLVKHDDDSSTEFDLGYAYRGADFNARTPNPALTVYKNTQNTETDWEYNAGILHAHKLTDDNTLRAGVQYNHWECPDGKRSFVGNRMDIHTLSGVLMDEQQWDRLTVDAGVRVTRNYYNDYTDQNFNIAGVPMTSRQIENEWGVPTVIGTLGAKYQLTKPVALYAHAAAGAVDAPPGAVSLGTNSVQRETRLLLDAGIAIEDRAFGSAKIGGFAVFRQNAILLSTNQIDGETFNIYENVEVRQYGLESEYQSIQFLNRFKVFGNATLMASEKFVDGEWTNYREIPNIVAAAGVNAVFGRLDVNVFGKYVSKYENRRFAADGKYHDLGDYVNLNVTAGMTFGRERATRVYVALKNVLNDKYSTVVGYPDYGFQAFVGLEYKM